MSITNSKSSLNTSSLVGEHTVSSSGVEDGSAAAKTSVTDVTLRSESSNTGKQADIASASVAEPIPVGMVGHYDGHVEIARNGFVSKSLSCFALNTVMGCSHACRFCYVGEMWGRFMTRGLRKYGIVDPDAQWGQYALLRRWVEKKFMSSLRKAENTPAADLNADGNRAIMFSSTTDPYQVFRAATPAMSKQLTDESLALNENCLERILKESTLNVRVLTRAPLAKVQFPLFKRFGHRLLFGMSLPTLNDKLARIYEPNAPSPTQRLKTLREAKEAGLNVYVAIAPTYPECDEADLHATLKAVAELKPYTVYHEPINIRGENVTRIAAHAASLGLELNTGVFATPVAYRQYAIEQLKLVERIAGEVGLAHCLHLWPDASLKSKNGFMAMRAAARLVGAVEGEDAEAYAEHLAWVERCHARISEWPKAGNKQ